MPLFYPTAARLSVPHDGGGLPVNRRLSSPSRAAVAGGGVRSTTGRSRQPLFFPRVRVQRTETLLFDSFDPCSDPSPNSIYFTRSALVPLLEHWDRLECRSNGKTNSVGKISSGSTCRGPWRLRRGRRGGAVVREEIADSVQGRRRRGTVQCTSRSV